MSNPYRPIDDCPAHQSAPPCPLYGGPLPADLHRGYGAGSSSRGDRSTKPPAECKYGACDECSAFVEFDLQNQPVRARERRARASTTRSP